MIFDKLARGIRKYAKLIIILWVVALLVAVPFALKSQGVFQYSFNSLAPADSESVIGEEMIEKYFSFGSDTPGSADNSSIQYVVIEFNSAKSRAYAENFADALEDAKNKDPAMSEKIASFTFLKTFTKEGSETEGICLIGAIYKGDWNHSVTDDTPNLRNFVKNVQSGYEGGNTFAIYITGVCAIGYDMMAGTLSDLKKIDPFTVLLILILIGLFFRSFITSTTPPLTIGFAFAMAMAAIFFIGQTLQIYFITELMILVAMMGAGCDYCIFIIARYREEMRSGKSSDDALHSAVVWAGESIAISGLSVVIGFGAMVACDYSMIQTMGLSLAIGILLALLAALTLIPSILYIVKDRIFWPSTLKTFENGGKSTRGWYGRIGNAGRRYFHRSAKFSLKHAKAIVIVAIMITAPAAYVVLTSEKSYDMFTAMETGDSGAGMDLIDEYANLGILMPGYIMFQYSMPFGQIITTTDKEGNTTGTIEWYEIFKTYPYQEISDGMYKCGVEIMENDSNITVVQGLFVFEREYEYYSYWSGTEDVMAVYDIIGEFTSMYVSEALNIARDTVLKNVEKARSFGFTEKEIVEMIAPTLDWVVNYNCGIVGGEVVEKTSEKEIVSISCVKMAIETDQSSLSNDSIRSIEMYKAYIDEYVESTQDSHVKVINRYVTGTGAFMLDVKEVVEKQFVKVEIIVVVLIFLLLLAVMRSWTIPFRSIATIMMSICWTLALTFIIFSTTLGGEVVWMVPMLLLVICLGLGMDYDILLTTRIKENVMKGMSNDDAIYYAVTHTGSVITVCGLIMGGAFGTLMLSGMEMMKEIGFSLCFAILIDALVIRTYVVPAVMHLLGNWNWRGPRSQVTLPLTKVNTYDVDSAALEKVAHKEDLVNHGDKPNQ